MSVISIQLLNISTGENLDTSIFPTNTEDGLISELFRLSRNNPEIYYKMIYEIYEDDEDDNSINDGENVIFANRVRREIALIKGGNRFVTY